MNPYPAAPDDLPQPVAERRRDKITRKLRGSDKMLKKVSSAGKVANRMDASKVRNMSGSELDVHYSAIQLDDAIDQISTGDLFLMSGTERFSKIIKRACLTTWSHACVAVVDPPQDTKEALAIEEHWNSRVFIFESDTETWDEREGGGVQLVCLAEYLADCFKEYGPDFLFAWRKLNIVHKPISNVWNEYPGFSEWMRVQRNKSYKHSKRELAGSALGVNIRQDESKVFCSELVAQTYQQLGLLATKENGGKRVNNYLPRDFSSGQRLDGKDILLLHQAYLNKERRIKL